MQVLRVRYHYSPERSELGLMHVPVEPDDSLYERISRVAELFGAEAVEIET